MLKKDKKKLGKIAVFGLENRVSIDLLAFLAQTQLVFLFSMEAPENGQTTRAAMQDYRSCCLFLTVPIWNELTVTPLASALHRADAVVGYLVNSLGLRHPSEPSLAVITALVACRSEENLAQLQSLLATVKAVMRTMVSRARISGLPLPAGHYVETLPNQVAQLPVAVREAAAPEGFAQIPDCVDLDKILQTARAIPLRSTHRDVQLQRQLQQGSAAILGIGGFQGMQMLPTAHMAQAAMVMAQGLAMQNNVQPQEAELKNLQIFGNRAAAAQPGHASVRMLMDRATASAVASVPASSSAAVGAPAAPAAPVEAMERVEDPALADSVAGPAPHEPGPEHAEELSLVPAGGEGGDTQGAADAYGQVAAPQHVSEAMDRLAQSYYGKGLPEPVAAEKEEGGIKRPAAAKGRPRKRPAAATSSLGSVSAETKSEEKSVGPETGAMKRPAANKVVAAKMCQRGAVPGCNKKPAAASKKAAASSASRGGAKGLVTRKQQLKLRPSGCSRCRNTPGCCPSCWTHRGYRVG